MVLAAGGVNIAMEVRLTDFDPDANGTELKAWQAGLDSSGYTSGIGGTLTPFAPACATDEDCKGFFPGACSIFGDACVTDSDCQLFAFGEKCGGSKCAFPVGIGGQCNPGYLLTGLPDYIFQSIDYFAAVDWIL